MEKIYESRRIALKAMIDQMGRGSIAKVAADIEVDPNYLSRCLYPPGKKGKKNIGDEMVIKLDEKYPQWSPTWKPPYIEGGAVITKPEIASLLTPMFAMKCAKCGQVSHKSFVELEMNDVIPCSCGTNMIVAEYYGPAMLETILKGFGGNGMALRKR